MDTKPMLYTGILVAELIALYYLSRVTTQKLFELFLLVFRARTLAVTAILLFEFPGTVVHELAHLFTAEILGVKTGKLRLEPESIRENDIQPGSVMVAHSDPFRRYMIGIAPLSWGIVMLTAVSYFLPTLWASVTAQIMPLFQNPDLYLLLLAGYAIFAVSNSMFPSPVDVHGILPYIITLAVLLTAGFFFGIRIQLTGTVLSVFTNILTVLVKSLGLVIGLNMLLLAVTGACKALILRIFRIRLRTS